MGWTKVWENENASLAGLNYPGKNIPLDLDGYREFRVVCYVNGMASNITASAVISTRDGDGASATANILICSEGYNGGAILEGRAFSYHKANHTLLIRDGWRWNSPSTYSATYNGQIKPAYIEAR